MGLPWLTIIKDSVGMGVSFSFVMNVPKPFTQVDSSIERNDSGRYRKMGIKDQRVGTKGRSSRLCEQEVKIVVDINGGFILCGANYSLQKNLDLVMGLLFSVINATTSFTLVVYVNIKILT